MVAIMRPREFARLAAMFGLLAAFPTAALAQHGLTSDSTAFVLTPAMRASVPTPTPTLHKPDMPPLTDREPRGTDEPSLAAPVAVGLTGAFLGALGMTYVAARGDNLDNADVQRQAAWGFVLGETVGMASGVHGGNRFRGSYPSDLGVAALGQVGALALGTATHSVGVYLVGIGGQLLWTLAVERRDRDEPPSDDAAPKSHRGSTNPASPDSPGSATNSDGPDSHGRTPVGDRHARH
jgi:hypothetical protein